MTLRVTPEFKRLLVLAAQAERRSRTNLLEVVLFEHCKAKGLTSAGETCHAEPTPDPATGHTAQTSTE